MMSNKIFGGLGAAMASVFTIQSGVHPDILSFSGSLVSRSGPPRGGRGTALAKRNAKKKKRIKQIRSRRKK